MKNPAPAPAPAGFAIKKSKSGTTLTSTDQYPQFFVHRIRGVASQTSHSAAV